MYFFGGIATRDVYALEAFEECSYLKCPIRAAKVSLLCLIEVRYPFLGSKFLTKNFKARSNIHHYDASLNQQYLYTNALERQQVCSSHDNYGNCLFTATKSQLTMLQGRIAHYYYKSTISSTSNILRLSMILVLRENSKRITPIWLLLFIR